MRKPKEPPFEVSEPQRYMADEGYFFHIVWRPKKGGPPYSIRCDVETLETVQIVADSAKLSMLSYLRGIRDELNKAKWLDHQESVKKKRGS